MQDTSPSPPEEPDRPPGRDVEKSGRWSLRTFLVSALLLVLLPIVLVGSRLYYSSLHNAAEVYTLGLGDEFSERIRERINTFMAEPERIVAFNVAQARAGYLRIGQPDDLMRQFLLQIGQLPQLTFVSMGLTDGQYFAGSRPPLGSEREPRMLQATLATGRAMEVFQVDEASQRAGLISRSEIHFDARTRPWYEAAIASGKRVWYGPYQYLIRDSQGAYATIGMGVSAPARDAQGRLLGVVTADVALSQINDFLRSVVAEFGGLAFMADAQGRLLASSTGEPTLRAGADPETAWPRMHESPNPLLRAAGQMLQPRAGAEGSQFIEVNGKRHLARWWTHTLNNGPTLTIGVVLPDSKFDTPLRKALNNVVYMTMGLILAALLFAGVVADRVVRSLAILGRRANRLTRGDWQAGPPTGSRIREVVALAQAMDFMAQRLQAHAQQLEQLVAQRTAALEKALKSVEQTLTDQRHFIAMLSHEVRSPLAVIHTAAQLLASRSKDTPSQRAIAKRILRGSTRLNYFFDNCLTQDRIGNQSFTPNLGTVDLAELIGWVVESGAPLSNDHRVEVQLQPGLRPLHGDSLLLRIMLSNLLSNAFKYSPAGEPVTLRAWADNGRCHLAVEDRGPGVPEEEVGLIFEKYRRGRGAEGKPGAGLGLALVQRIAELHGGTVRYARREPLGSCFTIELPFGIS